MVSTISDHASTALACRPSPEFFWPEAAPPVVDVPSAEPPPGDAKELLERDLVELIGDLAEVAHGDGKVLDELAVRFRDFEDRLQGFDRRLRKIEKLAEAAGH